MVFKCCETTFNISSATDSNIIKNSFEKTKLSGITVVLLYLFSVSDATVQEILTTVYWILTTKPTHVPANQKPTHLVSTARTALQIISVCQISLTAPTVVFATWMVLWMLQIHVKRWFIWLILYKLLHLSISRLF